MTMTAELDCDETCSQPECKLQTPCVRSSQFHKGSELKNLLESSILSRKLSKYAIKIT